MSEKTKKKNVVKENKIKKTKKIKPNIYARNFYYGFDEIASEYVTRISSALKPNQWLRITTNKNEFRNNSMSYGQGSSLKPDGIWYSKGEWLFHDIFGEMEYSPKAYLILIEIDPVKVYEIRNLSDKGNKINSTYKRSFNTFVKDYISYFDTEKGLKKGVNESSNDIIGGMISYKANWKKLSKKYDGFAMYPYPPRSYYLDKKNAKLLFPYGWDVSTLVLWNKKPIIKQYNFGYINDLKKGDFVDNIVSKINDTAKS